jgi:hypothetical protein
VAYFKVVFVICLEGLRKTTNTLIGLAGFREFERVAYSNLVLPDTNKSAVLRSSAALRFWFSSLSIKGRR